jgi:hypothetical protein
MILNKIHIIIVDETIRAYIDFYVDFKNMFFKEKYISFMFFIDFYLYIYHNSKTHRPFIFVIIFFFPTNLENKYYAASTNGDLYTKRRKNLIDYVKNLKSILTLDNLTN